MDLVEAYTSAAARTGELIAATQADQLESSTPCRTWTARELVNHLVGGQYMFAGAVGAQRDASRAAAASFAEPGLGDRMAELPFGTVPAGMVPGIACYEQVVHGWDLARATGQEPAMPAAVVAVLFPFAEQLLANVPRDGVAFAAVVGVPATAPVIDRLVALSGRRP